MPQVTITHPDSSTETIPKTIGYSWERELGKMFKLTITVERDDAQAVTLNKKEDEVDLSGVTAGRLVDIERGGPTYKLIVYSFEWDANRHPPTDGGDLRADTDKALIDTFINSVSEWTIGTTNTLTGTLTFVFNHALANEGMRRIERNTPGELRFNSDKSVDYVSSLGSDKSASITLSPSSANVDGDIQVADRGRTMDATHVRLIGAHEGEAQIFANLVPSSDGGTYDNRVNYSQPRWSSSADTDWARWSNKDVMDQATIEEEAAALADELVDAHLTVKATVVGEDLALGDVIHVTKPEADIDTDLRIRKIRTVSQGATVKDHVTLSTRQFAADTEDERIRDIQRYNVAFQGSAVWGTQSGGLQAVDSGLNYQLSFFYPDVNFEHTAELQVKSLPYRAFSSGAAAGGSSTETSANNTEFARTSDTASGRVNFLSVTQGDTLTGDTITPSSPTSSVRGVMVIDTVNVTSTTTVTVYMENETTGQRYPSNTSQSLVSLQPDSLASFTAADPTDCNGDTVTMKVDMTDVNESSIDVSLTTYLWAEGKHTHDVTLPDHTHPVNPGVTEFASETASGVDVVVNGSTTNTNIGTGTFETEVDLSGQLTKGAWNTIEVTSDSLGLLQCTMGITAYRQIGKS